MTHLRLALSFLTALPIAPRDVAQMGPARAYFPLVGLALGCVLAGLDFVARLALPDLAVGALLVVTLLVLTRAIHTEGFLDSCDGLFGGFRSKRRLEILRDTHVGAFAVIGGVALLLLKGSLLASIPSDIRVGLLVAFPCLSRFGMLSTMATFKYVREEGMGSSFQHGTNRWQIAFGLATAVLAAGLLLGGAGAVLIGFAVAVSLGLGRWIVGMLGGMTGDTYGAVNEVAEVTVLVVGITLFGMFPDLFWSALW